MNVTMVRAKVRPENAAEAEAAVKTMFAAINEARPQGVHYASTVLEDGVTFIALVAFDDPSNNPLPSIPAWVRFQEKLAAWRDGPPVIEPLTVVGSYGLFGAPVGATA